MYQVENDDEIQINDVEETANAVEDEVEALSAAKDSPLDEDEAAALELIKGHTTTPGEQIRVARYYARPVMIFQITSVTPTL